MIQVSANVYVETSIPMCNLGFVTTKAGIVMIDTPMFPTWALKWRDEVCKKGEIKYVINTEEHVDHFWGTPFFPGTLISSQITRTKISRIPFENFVKEISHSDPEGLPLLKQMNRFRLADITYTERLELFLGDHTFILFPLPGHSSGGTGIYIPEERLVFSSDAIFGRKRTWLRDATPSQWFESLKKLSDLDVDTIVPGHGEMVTKDYIKEQTEIVHRWVETAQSAMNQGLSAEEAAAKMPHLDPHPERPGVPYSEFELNRWFMARLYAVYSQQNK
jgi:cyclase